MRSEQVNGDEDQESAGKAGEKVSRHEVRAEGMGVLGKCKVLQIHFTSNPFAGAVYF